MAIMDAISSGPGLARRKKICRSPDADKPYEERQPSVYGGDRSANYGQHELMGYPTLLTSTPSTSTKTTIVASTSESTNASKNVAILSSSTSSSTLHESLRSSEASQDRLSELTPPPRALMSDDSTITDEKDEYFHRVGYTCHFTKVDMRRPLQSSRLRASMRENFGLSDRHFASRRGLEKLAETKVETEAKMDDGGDNVKKLGEQGKVDSMLMGHWPRFEFDDE